jgi:hypothetical protein
MLPASHGFL